jgi:hypothetical protein
VASRRQYGKVRDRLRDLSAMARALLGERGTRPSLRLTLPMPEVLASEADRDAACDAVRALCSTGGSYVVGRKRPSGKRSASWRQDLHAPPSQLHQPSEG